MSIYISLAGLIITAVGVVTMVAATVVIRVKSNQQENKSDKNSLLAASIFMGISILLVLITIITFFAMLASKGCGKSRWVFIVFLVLTIISLVIAIVIVRVFVNKKRAAGDNDSVRDLQSAWILPLISIGLMIVGLTLLYITIGRKFKKVAKICRKGGKRGGRSMVPV